MARKHYRYREPAVTLGEEKRLPESRSAIREKIMNRLETEGPFLQRYSNGEFTVSSLAVAKTFAECKAVQVLDTQHYTVHYDPELKIFWRHGGSFD